MIAIRQRHDRSSFLWNVFLILVLLSSFLIFTSDLIFSMIRTRPTPVLALDMLFHMTLSIPVNDLLPLGACIFSIASAIYKILGRRNWNILAGLSLVCLAVGFAGTAWYMVCYEGLIERGAEAFSGASGSRILNLMGQIGFLCWMAFSVSILGWRSPRWRGLRCWAPLRSLLPACGSSLHKIPMARRRQGSGNFSRGSWSLSRTAWYYVLLFLVPLCLRGCIVCLKSSRGEMASWLAGLASYAPTVVVAGMVVELSTMPFQRSHGLVLWLICLGAASSSLAAGTFDRCRGFLRQRCLRLATTWVAIVLVSAASWTWTFARRDFPVPDSLLSSIGRSLSARLVPVTLILAVVVLVLLVLRTKQTHAQEEFPEMRASGSSSTILAAVGGFPLVMPGTFLFVLSTGLLRKGWQTSAIRPVFDGLVILQAVLVASVALILAGILIWRNLPIIFQVNRREKSGKEKARKERASAVLR